MIVTGFVAAQAGGVPLRPDPGHFCKVCQIATVATSQARITLIKTRLYFARRWEEPARRMGRMEIGPVSHGYA